MTILVLLERKDDPLAKLYHDGADLQLTYLFDNTGLHLHQQQSPVWLHANAHSNRHCSPSATLQNRNAHP